jgi:hypothetical protein
MACSSCKKGNTKAPTQEELKKFANNMEKYIIGFMIVWTIFGFYGLYRLITDLI